MQEAEEQDTCRICSGPAEPDQPLFHPCKCSGTIRYIHQDCLTTWLSHSKKKTCDVCKHPYSFTKVYAEDMPSRLPLVLLLRKLIEQVFYTALFCIRSAIVGFMWLAILPMVTVWTWRMYFTVGDAIAWWISNQTRPSDEPPAPTGFFHAMTNGTVDRERLPLVAKFTNHPVWLAFWSDIFTGQIIASLIVLSFVAVFLLREWISQNAGPGLFDGEDMVDELPIPEPPRHPPLPPVRRPIQQPPPHLQLPQTQNAVDAPPQQLDAQLRPTETPMELTRNAGGSRHRSRTESARPPQTLKGKGRALRRSHLRDSSDVDEQDPPSVSELRHRKHAFDKGKKYEFTFRAPRRSHSEPRAAPSSSSPVVLPTLPSPEPDPIPRPSISHAMRDRLERFYPDHLPTRANIQPTAALRRPPLPTISLPSPSMDGGGTIASAPILPPSTMSRGQSPASPSLAMYYPPEELQAGPSRPADYFGAAASTNTATQDEFNEYFAEESVEIVGKLRGTIDGEDDLEILPTETDDEQNLDIPDGGLRELVDDEEAHDSPALFDAGDEDDMPDLMPIQGSDDEEIAREETFNSLPAPAPELLAYEDLPPPPVPAPLAYEDLPPPIAHVDLLDLPADVPPPPIAPAAPVAPLIPEPPPPALDPNDDLEGQPDEDMDGILEAIGLRGPFYAIIQNAALVIFILDTVLGVVIWIPFSVGKTTALLTLNPHRLLRIIDLPLRLIRIITDPLVDGTGHLLMVYVIPFLMKVARTILNTTIMTGYFVISKYSRESADKLFRAVASTYFTVLSLGDHPIFKATHDIFSFKAVDNSVVAPKTNLTTVLDYLPSSVLATEPHFAAIGKEVRTGYTALRTAWAKLAVGQGPMDRAFAIILGYLVASFMLAVYLNLLTLGNMRTTGRAVRKTVRQQLLVLKVAGFILIELVIFPLCCGIVLDLCTIWLFPEANLASRFAYFYQAPLTAVFYHWVAGTMFMYTFAIMLSGCRTVMRPGAMWFIKDPQDHNSHPIRDILERPTLLQLRKICISGVMYSIVVACVVGSVAGLLLLGSKSIMPFRWKNREPLSSVPIDLLFLNFVLPYSMKYFEPKNILKKAVIILWTLLAEELRLTSYFFGHRVPGHEVERLWAWNPFKPLVHEPAKFAGEFRRVPATDNIALGRDMRATAPVTEQGEPINDAARELIRIQDAEAVKAKRDPKEDYKIVYIPPMFRWRVIAFIASLWTVGSICMGLIVALPILFGRGFFSWFINHEVHDGYSFILGFHLLWACFLIASAVDRLNKSRQRADGTYEPRRDLAVLVAKRGILWLCKISYMIVMLGIIIPPLLSIMVELYITFPIRLLVDPDLSPKIRLVDSWAMGLLYGKIALQINTMQQAQQQPGQQPHHMSDGLRNIVDNGWLNPKPIRATREVILPAIVGLLGMILLPAGGFKALQQVLPALREQDNKFILLYVYPGIFVVVGALQAALSLSQLSVSWSQAIRDKEFLVEMRLRNHEPEMPGGEIDTVIQDSSDGVEIRIPQDDERQDIVM